MTAQPLADDPIAEIAASRSGPEVGAFFDLDGTLVDGFTATAHASDRIRRRQARIGEVLGVVEASMRYRLGRMRFEHLLTRAAGYLQRRITCRPRRTRRKRCSSNSVATRVFPAMREIVAAHQERGHTGGAQFLGVDHPCRAGGPLPGHRPRAVQPLRGRRRRSPHRPDRQTCRLGAGTRRAPSYSSARPMTLTCNAVTSMRTATRTRR